MDNIPIPATTIEILWKQIRNLFSSCLTALPCIKRHHQVHPFHSGNGERKSFHLNAQRRINVIHIDSHRKTTILNSVNNADNKTNLPRRLSNSSNKSDESMGEYWFTRWNRPLTLFDNCNCSFRRVCRKPVQNILSPSALQTKDNVHFIKNKETVKFLLKKNPKGVVKPMIVLSSHIEIFAEDFIKSILNEALSQVDSRIKNKDCNNCNTQVKNLKPTSITRHSLKSQTVNTIAQLSPCSSKEVLRTKRPFHIDSCLPKKRNNSVMNANTGCVNPMFVNSPSDPGATVVAPRRACKHVKRIMKPILFFLHGVGSCSEVWWNQLQFFAAIGYEIVAPDMLGHGSSAAPDSPTAYTFQCLLKDAVDIFDRFVGEHGKCVVIGHDYGCSLAAALARYRTQVTQLVLISGGGPTPLAPTHEVTLFPCLQRCLKSLLFCGCKRDALYAPCGKHMVACESLSEGMPRHVLRYMAMGQDWPEGDSTFHRRILVPTLLVHGMLDPHVTLVQECEMERTIPRSFLELIPNAGHHAMLETPDQLSHMIHCFIEWWAR